MEDKMHFKNETGELTLEVNTNHNEGFTAELAETFWKVFKMSELDSGNYALYVVQKIAGEKIIIGNVIKIIGLDGREALQVLLQSSGDNCYIAVLRRKNTSDGTIYGSKLLGILQKVTGVSWFNPRHPTLKKLTSTIKPGKSRPLQSLEDKLGQALPEEQLLGLPASISCTAPIASKRWLEYWSLVSTIASLEKVRQDLISLEAIKAEIKNVGTLIEELNKRVGTLESSQRELVGQLNNPEIAILMNTANRLLQPRR